MADFYVIATNIGEAKMANALALGIPLAITELALGDGEGDAARGTPVPNPEATALVSERRRAPLNSFAVDPDNTNVLIAEQVIPETAGGWWIREMGLFDEDGDMIFVCNTPPTYKPQLSEGSGRTQVVRMASIVSNTAAVTLKVDPSVVLATRQYVQEILAIHADEFDKKVNIRTIHAGSVAEIEALSLPVGAQVSLTEPGRIGDFKIISGNFSTQLAADTESAEYIGLADDPTAATKVARRQYIGKKYATWWGLTGDGAIDDRVKAQAALDSLVAGETLVFAKGFDFRIVNAEGAGATIVERRADAVLNSTLHALTCAADDVTVIINGTITGTSPLDDIIRFTGDEVVVKGTGRIRNVSGEFLDTNSTDPTLQWRPANLKFEGNECDGSGVKIVDQPTIGVADYGNFNALDGMRFKGGPTTHGSGTVHFGVEQAPPGGFLRKGGSVKNCIFLRSAGNGATYSGVFSVMRDAEITGNYFNDLMEHGVYANSTGNTINGNRFRNIQMASAIQSFNGGTIQGNRFVDCAFGQINVARPNETNISGNVMVNAGLSGIAVRTGTGDPGSTVYNNLTIADNIIDYVGAQSAIDVSLVCGIDGLTVTGNQIRNAAGSSLYGPLRIEVTPASATPGKTVNISNNTVNGSEIYTLYLNRFSGGKVHNNTLLNASRSVADVAARFFECDNIEFDKNTIHSSGATTRMLFATASDGNSNILATNNNGIGLGGTSGKMCDVNGTAFGNGRNTLGTKGTFTAVNFASDTITDGAAGSVRPPGLVVLTPANAVAHDIQAGAQRISVTAIADGSFTWSTKSGNAIGTAGATYFYEVVQ